MADRSLDSFSVRSEITVAGRKLAYFSLPKFAEKTGLSVQRLPFSLRILLENLLRHEDGRLVRRRDIEALSRWDPASPAQPEIAFMPARVLLQDFTGVPAVVDLAAMRDEHPNSGW